MVEVSRLDMEVLKGQLQVVALMVLLRQQIDEMVHLEFLAKAVEVVVQASFLFAYHQNYSCCYCNCY